MNRMMQMVDRFFFGSFECAGHELIRHTTKNQQVMEAHGDRSVADQVKTDTLITRYLPVGTAGPRAALVPPSLGYTGQRHQHHQRQGDPDPDLPRPRVQ